MKVNKVLSREETRKLQKEMGVVDLPYRDEVEAILKREFSEGGIVMDDYIVGKVMDEKPSQKFAEGGMSKQMSMFEDGGLSTAKNNAMDKLDSGVEELRDDRKKQFDKMTNMLTSGEVKNMSLKEQENFVQLYKMLKQHHNFAEGGMPNDGGLMDEGGTIDPVSGNDVPPGSTKEEVRDDIPAQLSEGEFVFPADVVRYIGLEKLMQMRQQAKMGLQTMDDMGQMGNSEEAIMPDDIPFELSDLDIDDDPVELQQGGLLGPAAGISGYVPSHCLLYTSPSPRDGLLSRMPSSA